MTNVVQPLLSHEDKALGVENGSISDKQITASSEKNTNQAAILGRLNFEALSGKVGSWTARENDVYQWLQIDLGNHDTEVTKIATQGGNSIDNWVTKYKLQYSDDGVTFKYYRKERCCKGKVFAGNEDTNSVVEHRLTPPVKSRYIRFQPLHWHNGISMRVELYGCEVPKPREKEFEDKLMDTIDDGNFEVIKQSLTPVALGKCESNPLQMGMKVNFKLRELAEKMGPDKERFQELANSVEEFTSCFLDPLRCDKQWLMTFGDLVLDDQLNVAIENGQKKFFTHPVVHEEMKRKWDGRHFSRRKWKWWQKLLFHVWCVFDLMLFSIILYPLSYWKNIKEEQRRDEPKIEKAPESQNVCVGDSVEFKCEVSGKPNLDMTWYKEGEELKNTENKLEITTTRVLVGNQRKHIEEKECTLKIINAQIEDQGEYTFTVKNDFTDPPKSATFTVEVKEETKNGKLDEAGENKVDDVKEETNDGKLDEAGENKVDDAPAKITSAEGPKKARVGDEVTFICEVSGNPNPSTTWYKDGEILKSSIKEHILMKTEQDSSKLVIETVQVSAQGCYTCVAKNEFGEHKRSFCLAVVKDPYYVLYLDYVKSPYYKFVRDIMSYFLLLGLHFALCLEPATKEMSELEWAIFVLFLGRYLVERKQIRQQRSTYFGDTWNMLDLTSLLVYLLIFLLRITAWVMPGSWAASKVVLALAGYLYAFNTLCLTFRTFCHLMLQSKTIGIIQIAFFDTIKVITLVIAQCLAVLLAFTIALTKVSMDDKSLLGKGTEGKGIHTLWSMFKHLTWSILGKSDEFEREEFVEPMSHIVSQLFLVAFYVIAIILLLNMLIALLTSTYEKIQKNSFLNWSFERAITIQTYEVYDPIPVPLNIIYNAGKLLWCLVRILRYKCRSPEKKQIVGFEHFSFFQYVKKKYDEKYGNLFPAKDPLLEEAERNRQMTSQIIRTTFPQQGYCGGPQDWESHERVRIEGVHLTCEGEDPSWYDFGGARYRTAFSAQSRDFEVIVLETGKKELGIGVVWEGYKLCRTPGIYNNSLGYHTKVGIIYHNDDDGRNTEGPVMARRGDLIRCTMINEEKISGEVSFLFTINGRKISVEEGHVEQFILKKSKGPLYPYVSMSEGCIVLARML